MLGYEGDFSKTGLLPANHPSSMIASYGETIQGWKWIQEGRRGGRLRQKDAQNFIHEDDCGSGSSDCEGVGVEVTCGPRPMQTERRGMMNLLPGPL